MAPNFLGLFVAPCGVAGERVATRSSLFARTSPPCYLLHLSIHLHLPSPIPPLSLYTRPLSNSEPAWFWKPMSVSLPNLESRLFFAAQPQWSLGAWGRRLVTLVWPSPPSQPAIKIGGRGGGFQPSLPPCGERTPSDFYGLRTDARPHWHFYVRLTTLEKARVQVSWFQIEKLSLGDWFLNWSEANAIWIIELKASTDDTIVIFLWQSGDIKMAGLILNGCDYFDGK